MPVLALAPQDQDQVWDQDHTFQDQDQHLQYGSRLVQDQGQDKTRVINNDKVCSESW